MVRQLRARLTLIFLIAILVQQSGCVNSPTPEPDDQPSAPPVSLLVHLDKPAFIKREGWKDYHPVGFGALVYSTDLLKTDGVITLLCADLQTVKTLTGLGRNPCPIPHEGFVLKYDNMLFSPGVRGSTLSTIPTLISPRNTTILDAHPTLRWQDTGATSYTVEILQGGDTIWISKEVPDTEIVYPAEAPVLEAGKDYILVVTAGGRSSTEDKEKGLGFQVVGNAERTETEAQKRAIFNLADLDEPAQKFALAMYYINLRIGGRGLWNDARLLLEEISQTRPNEPVVFLRLGDVLAKMKLWNDAVDAYQKALAQAQKTGDLETQADGLAALWRINPSNQAQFDQAVSIYEQIGALDKANRLRKELEP